MFTPGEEGDIEVRPGESPPEVSAHSAGSDYCNLHKKKVIVNNPECSNYNIATYWEVQLSENMLRSYLTQLTISSFALRGDAPETASVLFSMLPTLSMMTGVNPSGTWRASFFSLAAAMGPP